MSEEELNQMSNNELIGIIKAQKFEIEQLENIRKEAIEYITTEQLYTNYQWGKSQYVKILKDLLNILNKGSENNELD